MDGATVVAVACRFPLEVWIPVLIVVVGVVGQVLGWWGPIGSDIEPRR